MFEPPPDVYLQGKVSAVVENCDLVLRLVPTLHGYKIKNKFSTNWDRLLHKVRRYVGTMSAEFRRPFRRSTASTVLKENAS